MTLPSSTSSAALALPRAIPRFDTPSRRRQGRAPARHAAELAKLNCDVLFGARPEVNLVALKQVSAHTPIVFVAVDFDPFASGHITNPGRPEGRVTGISAEQSVLPGKQGSEHLYLSPCNCCFRVTDAVTRASVRVAPARRSADADGSPSAEVATHLTL
jgi:hypothetical protein